MQVELLFIEILTNNIKNIMLPFDKINTPGEHPFFFLGKEGRLEAILTIPETMNPSFMAILGHPHSLQGGSMSNKVVTTMARACRELGIASIRFNFRGVGQSEGQYDAGIGESEDMLILKNMWSQHAASCQFIIAGFSFGSYVAYRAAALSPSRLLITIAPAVNHYDYQELLSPDNWHIFMGDHDEVVPFSEVERFAQNHQPPLPITHFVNTGHFFHGNLILLKSELMSLITKQALT